jgi:hypothetical protein
MQLNINITGLDKIKAQMGNLSKQANFAASKALNTTAFAVNTEIKKEMQTTFQGGATAYALRAFKVEGAKKDNLVATVALRTDTNGAALPYSKALGHMFTGGRREYKKLEAMLHARKLLPSGLSIAPGDAMRLDRYGNMDKGQLTEVLTMLLARPSTMRVIRKTGKGKPQKLIDYFVVQPGAKTKLHPGIYKRIETGKTSAVDAMMLFITPVAYRQYIDLQTLGNRVANSTFQPAFDKELAAALASAKP